MSNKHFSPDETPVDLPDDNDQNPGIGQSKALFARAGTDGAELIAGDNTVEGDVANDGGGAGGVDMDLGRTNK